MTLRPTTKKLLIAGPAAAFFGLPLVFSQFCIEGCTKSSIGSVVEFIGLVMVAVGTLTSVYAILSAIYQTRIPKALFWGGLVPGLLLWLVLFFIRRK